MGCEGGSILCFVDSQQGGVGQFQRHGGGGWCSVNQMGTCCGGGAPISLGSSCSKISQCQAKL